MDKVHIWQVLKKYPWICKLNNQYVNQIFNLYLTINNYNNNYNNVRETKK